MKGLRGGCHGLLLANSCPQSMEKDAVTPRGHPHLLALGLVGLGVSHLNAFFPHEGHASVCGVVVMVVSHDGVHAGARVVPREEALFLIIGMAEGESGCHEGVCLPCHLGLTDNRRALGALIHMPLTCASAAGHAARWLDLLL